MSKNIFKELTSHSLLYTIGSFAGLASSVLLMPVYTRFLSKADYGVLEMTDTMYSLLIIIFITGFSQAVAKLFNDAKTDEEKQKVFGTMYWSSLILGGVVGCLLLLFYKKNVSLMLLGSDLYAFQIGLSFSIFIVSPAYLMAIYYFNLQKKPKTYVLIGLIRLVINVCFNMFYIVHLRMGSAGMLLGEFSTTLVLLIVLTFYLLKNYKLRYSFSTLAQALKFGLPLIPALFCSTLMHKADRYLIQKYCQLSDVGLYSMGVRFPSLLNFVLLGSFSQIWGATGLYDVAKLDDSKNVQARLATYFFIIITICYMSLAFFAPTILHILTTPEFFASQTAMQIVACSMIIYSLNTFFQTGAFVKSKTWVLTIANVVAAGVTIGFNILLLPHYGYIASAWITVATYTAYVSVLYFLCNRFYPIVYDFKRMGLFFGFSLALLFVNNLFTLNNYILDAFKQAALFLMIPAFVLFTKFLKEDEVSELGSLLYKINPLLSGVYLKMRSIPDLLISKIGAD